MSNERNRINLVLINLILSVNGFEIFFFLIPIEVILVREIMKFCTCTFMSSPREVKKNFVFIRGPH